jgi:threonine aldolase
MRDAMANAEVGDDVFGDDPTVKRLEEKMAEVFGKQAAVFVPSGTMGNLVAVGVHCEVRGSEYVCGDLSHIVHYEQGGLATLMGAHSRQLPTNADGTLDVAAVEGAIRTDDQHFPRTRVVCLESTHNKRGGKVLPLAYVDEVGELCKKYGVKLHVDGARIWNAAAHVGATPARCVLAADSVSVCLSKGLGAPVGSVILGDQEFIRKCRRLRKACGGGMRQAGTLAAAALAAFEEIGPRIHDDHVRAARLAAGVRTLGEYYRVQVEPETNIFFVDVNVAEYPALNVEAVVEALRRDFQIATIPWIGDSMRIVTHHEITEEAEKHIVRGFLAVAEGLVGASEKEDARSGDERARRKEEVRQ